MLVSVFASTQSAPVVYDVVAPSYGMSLSDDYDMYDLYHDVFYCGYSIAVHGSIEECEELMDCLSEHGDEYEPSDGCYGVTFEGLVPDVQMSCLGETGMFVPVA